MNLILIRHGEPDYSHIQKTDSTKLPTLASLSQNGIKEAKKIYTKGNFESSQIILSSPFTRALETAKILNESLKLPLYIEEDLHEWLPDRNFNLSVDSLHDLYRDYKKKNGIRIDDEPWEEDNEVRKRVLECLQKYKDYTDIIIVAHSRLFKVVFGVEKCDYCSINWKEIEI